MDDTEGGGGEPMYSFPSTYSWLPIRLLLLAAPP